SGVRSIAWLDRLRDAFNEFLCALQRPLRLRQEHVLHPVFVWWELLAVLEFADEQRAKAGPMRVFAALQILLGFGNGFFERLDALKNSFFLRVHCSIGMAHRSNEKEVSYRHRERA